MSVRSLLLKNQKNLTAAQQRVMKFIIDNYEEAIFLTASRVAQKAGVSEATVVRLAQALGLEGYPDLQKLLRKELQGRLSTVARLEQSVKHVRGEDDVIVKVLQEDLQNLSQTLRDMPVDSFRRAVSEIQSAKRIYIAGLRGAHSPALVLALYLRYLEKDARLLIPGNGDVWNNIFGISHEDLVIGISLPRYTRVTVEILQYAHREGAKVGAITDSLMSPLAEYANWVLPVSCHLDSFIESFTSTMSVVNAILTALSVRNPSETMRALTNREKMWKEKNIYIIDSNSK